MVSTTPPDTLDHVPDVTGYDANVSFYATRFRQGSRIVFSLDLSLEQLASILPAPDPTKTAEGNRAIRPQHAAGFGQYIREHEDWVAPGLLLRSTNMFDFDVQAEVAGSQFGILSFPRLGLLDLHILDGQHRTLGIHLALKGITEDLDRARSNLASARRNEPGGIAEKEFRKKIAVLEAQRKRLASERISVQIFVENDLLAYRQMFFDIADNALGITASVRSRFDARKVVNRAFPLTADHALLIGRVDPEKDHIGRGSPFLLGAKHIVELIRVVNVGLDGRIGKRNESEMKEADLAANTKAFLSRSVEAFGDLRKVTLGEMTPDELRRSSLLGSVIMLRLLAAAGYDLIAERDWSGEQVEDFYRLLDPHMGGPTYPGSVWTEHMPGLWDEGAFSPRSRRQDLRAVKSTLVEWARDRPKFLTDAPAPRPEPDVDPEYGTGYTDMGFEIPA